MASGERQMIQKGLVAAITGQDYIEIFPRPIAGPAQRVEPSEPGLRHQQQKGWWGEPSSIHSRTGKMVEHPCFGQEYFLMVKRGVILVLADTVVTRGDNIVRVKSSFDFSI